ncbi:terpenoid cyclases/protein prenyltransferase alpha-alpha toroid [Flagelloscypha sp. PMI_526]|nr:terpenoid cyclases/protein prenyltransferase alpha-alpha toroid [Flagelloscypha sp. PMI_526]
MNPVSTFNPSGHIGAVRRCLSGLPFSAVEAEGSLMALVFYSLASFDLLGVIDQSTSVRPLSEKERKVGPKELELDLWKEWIWEQYVTVQKDGIRMSGFKPGPWMTSSLEQVIRDEPNLITTYTGLLNLCLLRDETIGTRIDSTSVKELVRACQHSDGSFSTTATLTDGDLRTTYCAFVLCYLMDDWSCLNLETALEYISRCRTYEGGYGQFPGCEAQGGTTYTALASLYLSTNPLSPKEKNQTTRWLTSLQSQCSQSEPLKNQDSDDEDETNAPSARGGFAGRTNKVEDACYCFWCGASLKILSGTESLLSVDALVSFLSGCQFRFGGIAKAAGDTPDPYHTYLSLAVLSAYPPQIDVAVKDNQDDAATSWKLWIRPDFDPLVNARADVVNFGRRWLNSDKTSDAC